MNTERISALKSLNWRGLPPRFHESVWGVLQKLTHLNALSASERRRWFCLRGSPTAASQTCAHELWFPLCDMGALRALLPASETHWPDWLAQPPGFSASFNELRDAHLRYCPRCLEHGFHSVLFQSGDIARCPEHDEPLQGVCFGCQGPIPYWGSRPTSGAFECQCGHLLWRSRDSVTAWYPPSSFGRRLDGFAQRLKQSAVSGGAAWLVQHAPPPTSTWMGPSFQRSVLFGMPPCWHRVFHPERFLAQRTRYRLPLEAVYRPVTLSLAQCTERLMHLAVQEARVHLPNHSQCLAAPVTLPERPPSLLLGTCVIANARRLWQWQWSDTQMQRRVHELLLWAVIQTLHTLQQRRILRSRMIAAIPQWGSLAAFIGQRILLRNLRQWLVAAGHILEYWAKQQRKPTSAIPCPFRNIPFEPRLPLIWARPASRANRYLDVFHDGPTAIAAWNAMGCSEPISAVRDPYGHEEYEIRDALTRLLETQSREWTHPSDAGQLFVDTSDDLNIL